MRVGAMEEADLDQQQGRILPHCLHKQNDARRLPRPAHNAASRALDVFPGHCGSMGDTCFVRSLFCKASTRNLLIVA
jgi:hypothetical protein